MTDGFTAEEESATLEALLRAALYKLVDFSRIILMRSASDIDRPPPGLTAYDNLFTDAGGFEPALMNLYAVGEPIIQGIIKDWKPTFKKGITGMRPSSVIKMQDLTLYSS
jgi:purine nucleoside permease